MKKIELKFFFKCVTLQLILEVGSYHGLDLTCVSSPMHSSIVDWSLKSQRAVG